MLKCQLTRSNQVKKKKVHPQILEELKTEDGEDKNPKSMRVLCEDLHMLSYFHFGFSHGLGRRSRAVAG